MKLQELFRDIEVLEWAASPELEIGDISYDVKDPMLRNIMDWYDETFSSSL